MGAVAVCLPLLNLPEQTAPFLKLTSGLLFVHLFKKKREIIIIMQTDECAIALELCKKITLLTVCQIVLPV